MTRPLTTTAQLLALLLLGMLASPVCGKSYEDAIAKLSVWAPCDDTAATTAIVNANSAVEAEQRVASDHVAERLSRIERRLDSSEAGGR